MAIGAAFVVALPGHLRWYQQAIPMATARDVDAIVAHCANRAEVMDHTTGAIYDQQAMLPSWLSLLRARDGTYRNERGIFARPNSVSALGER